jgi:hypothetical protein
MIWRDDEGESYGQVDGDSSGPVQFVSSLPSVGIPWMREGIPPWHLWGNSQTLDALVQTVAAGQVQPTVGQLAKISYKRPETWHWIFSTKLISGPSGDLVAPAGAVTVNVYFDLIVGTGRSAILMQQITGVGFPTQSFEQHTFQWDAAGGGFPVGAKIWTTRALAPGRTFRTFAPFSNTSGNAVPPEESAGIIDKIVAQDIQLSCRVFATTGIANTALGGTVQLEVSAAFAPAHHIRPDWFDDGVPEQRYAGAETGGK